MMDRMPDDEDLPGAIRKAVERNGDRITDLHLAARAWPSRGDHRAGIRGAETTVALQGAAGRNPWALACYDRGGAGQSRLVCASGH